MLSKVWFKTTALNKDPLWIDIHIKYSKKGVLVPKKIFWVTTFFSICGLFHFKPSLSEKLAHFCFTLMVMLRNSFSVHIIQVNLCQKLFFLQNMGRTCCVQKLFWMSEPIYVNNIFSPSEFSCIELVIQWTISVIIL